MTSITTNITDNINIQQADFILKTKPMNIVKKSRHWVIPAPLWSVLKMEKDYNKDSKNER